MKVPMVSWLRSSPDAAETPSKSLCVSDWWAQWWAHFTHLAVVIAVDREEKGPLREVD
jgi:hypothetical protein